MVCIVIFIISHENIGAMVTKALLSALTLYDARTLSLSQAATQAGLSESEFVRQLERRGVEVAESERATAVAADRTAHAD